MPLSPVDFGYIRTLLSRNAAIVLEDDKVYLVEARLLPLARREGFPSIADLVAKLRAGRQHELHQKVVEAMTTNETSFFRDLQPFEALRKVVLPELLQRRASERRLHIWCAACSTGQEPYTVAMILREHFGALWGWKVRILGTDLSTEVLDRARQGRYSQLEIGRGLPAAYLMKYFQRQGVDWQLQPEIRAMVEFGQRNLIEPWPAMPAQDIVLLRNVLIYFAVPTKKQILGNIRRVLRPDGYLFLGGAETTLSLDDAFGRLNFDRSGCYQLRKS